MSTRSAADSVRLHDHEELPTRLAEYDLTTSVGWAALTENSWHVVLSTDGDQIMRDVWLGEPMTAKPGCDDKA
jgi:hypothetical protein